MISNQILQNTIDGLKAITRIDLCVMDTDGKSLASTFAEQENYEASVLSFVESPADSQVIQDISFLRSLMSISLSTSSWPTAEVTMSTWSGRSPHSRYRRS